MSTPQSVDWKIGKWDLEICYGNEETAFPPVFFGGMKK